ncbi:hypothetical protein [Paenibacillus sp. A3]|uniref:hypothetical protein n=1 Tax=Paenibacillus sp. A3 TaxID=1337054 RepID=UPI0006D5AC7F|nr:hypothetical protein [Paenibacillus sp. A3]
MTAQIPHSFIYLGHHDYSLAAVEKDWPFKPKQYGFTPVAYSSACWRGYKCHYVIEDKKLYLDTLTIGLEDSVPPVWNGISAAEAQYGAWEYHQVGLPLEYSGGIVLCRGFINEMYVHMGTQRPYSYRQVLELSLEKGLLTDVTDYSKEMKEIRKFLLESQSKIPNSEADKRLDDVFLQAYVNKWGRS